MTPAETALALAEKAYKDACAAYDEATKARALAGSRLEVSKHRRDMLVAKIKGGEVVVATR